MNNSNVGRKHALKKRSGVDESLMREAIAAKHGLTTNKSNLYFSVIFLISV